jgi:CelD/BcsL family acetyltransferase involved in cellulose biosynthesis
LTVWRVRSVPFKFQLSDLTLLTVSVPLLFRGANLLDVMAPAGAVDLPSEPLPDGCEGYAVHALPVANDLPKVSRRQGFIWFVQLDYLHSYIDLRCSFEDYQRKFSSKTRSTINRKIRKYAEFCQGNLVWKSYSTPDEIRAFLPLARAVSRTTYQERLLDAGIPTSQEFYREAERLAEQQQVRGYVLFHNDSPVSYLYCPAEDGVLTYAYLGYDPAYLKMSVGTILQWLALKSIFEESRFSFFDFTEGTSEHKRLFATNSVRCVNMVIVRDSLRNRLLVEGHRLVGRLSGLLGDMLERMRMKAAVKRMLRFRQVSVGHRE